MGSEGVGDERWRVGAWQVWRCECCLGGLLTCAHAMRGPVHRAHRLLANNQLSGSIPDSIGNLAQLTQLCVGCCVLACVVECGVWVDGQ